MHVTPPAECRKKYEGPQDTWSYSMQEIAAT